MAEWWATKLASSNSLMRWIARRVLTQMGSSAVVALVQALQHPKEEVRDVALAILKKIPPSDLSMPLLVDAVGHPLIAALLAPDTGFVQHASFCLKAMFPQWETTIIPQVTPILLKALVNHHHTIRQSADAALQELNPKWYYTPIAQKLIPFFIHTLVETNNRDIRLAAHYALTVIPYPWESSRKVKKCLPMLLKAAQEPKQPFWENLCRKLGIHKVDPDTLELRRYATQALCKVKHIAPGILPVLIQNIMGPDRTIRIYAIYALKKMGPAAQQAVHALAHVILDEDRDIRNLAAQALGAIGPIAIPVLLPALLDGAWDIRCAAALALGDIGEPAKQAIPTLIKMLSDEEIEIRNSAARALANMGPAAQQALPALVIALSDENQYVRRHAAMALGQLGVLAQPAVLALSQLLADQEWHVRLMAAEAFFKIGAAAQDAIPTLLKALSDEDMDVRMTVQQALAQIDPQHYTLPT